MKTKKNDGHFLLHVQNQILVQIGNANFPNFQAQHSIEHLTALSIL